MSEARIKDILKKFQEIEENNYLDIKMSRLDSENIIITTSLIDFQLLEWLTYGQWINGEGLGVVYILDAELFNPYTDEYGLLSVNEDLFHIFKNHTKLILTSPDRNSIFKTISSEFKNSISIVSPINIPDPFDPHPILYLEKKGIDLIECIDFSIKKYKFEQEKKVKTIQCPSNSDEPKYTLRQLRGAWGAGRNSR